MELNGCPHTITNGNNIFSLFYDNCIFAVYNCTNKCFREVTILHCMSHRVLPTAFPHRQDAYTKAIFDGWIPSTKPRRMFRHNSLWLQLHHHKPRVLMIHPIHRDGWDRPTDRYRRTNLRPEIMAPARRPPRHPCLINYY